MRTRVPGFGSPVGQASGRRNSIRTLTCARFGGHARAGTRMNAELADSRGFVPDSSAPLRRIRVHPCSLIQRGWRAAGLGRERALVLRTVTKSSNNPRERRAPGCYGWFTTPNLPRPVVAFNTLRARTAVD